ncbi:MAG: NUDIX domain-containing protein [bacterium]|nr:NUDIX domain-containing protein [bacterium]
MYCPKCGYQTFEPDTEKSFRCSKCSFQFFLNTAAAVTAIIKNSKGEILFTVRKHDPVKGTLDLPGGFSEYGETGEEALKREIKEELNIELTDITYFKTLPNIYKYAYVVYNTLDLIYNCTTQSMTDIKPSDDVSDYKFIHLDNVNIDDIGLISVKNLIEFLKSESCKL